MKKLIALLLAACLMLGLMTTAFAADEKSNDIVILHTNDAHCGVSDGLGYAGVAAYKAEMEQTHNYVTLVDCGDAIQGEPIGLLSAGSYLVDIMNEVGYDLATFGNHEFDYKLPRLAELTKLAKYQYVSCNFKYIGKGTEKVGGRWFYSGGQLARPVVSFCELSLRDALEMPGAYQFNVAEAGLSFVGFRLGPEGGNDDDV